MGFNYRIILRVVSMTLIITGGSMIFPLICAFYTHEELAIRAMIIAMCLSLSFGLFGYFGLGYLNNHRDKTLERSLKTRDCYMMVILSWVCCSLAGSLPYFLSGEISGFINCLFESVSGYTSSGVTCSGDLVLTKPMILWKAISHWLGGMGILVFMISILPSMGVESQKIAVAEAPGLYRSKIAPKSKDMGTLIYLIYISFTAIGFFVFWAHPKMSAFDALITIMGSVSTSGIFAHPEGLGYYDSVYIEVMVAVFTLLSAIDFVLYISLVKRNFKNIKNNTEVKVFLTVVGVVAALNTIVLFINHTYDSILACLRYGFVQTAAFATTAGYSHENCADWPSFCFITFIVLMFIGGCASSTSGGMKAYRFTIMIKMIFQNFKQKIHPSIVSNIKIGDKRISPYAVESVIAFILLYIGTFLAGALVISLGGHGLKESLSSSLALLSTTGLFFHDGGISGSFELFSQPIKLFMTLIMVVGRLELFSVLMIFSRSFWNPDKSKLQ